MAPVRAPTNHLLTPAKAPLLVQGVQFLKAAADLVNGLRSTNPYISSISRNVKYFSLVTVQIYFGNGLSSSWTVILICHLFPIEITMLQNQAARS